MPGYYQITMRDYGDELSTVKFACASLTAATFDAQLALAQTLRSTIEAVTLGITARTKWVSVASRNAGGEYSADPNAQREDGWLLVFENDVTGKTYTLSVPCADLGIGTGATPHLDPAGEVFDQTHADWVALKAAFEAVVVAPDSIADQAVTLLEAIYVGRNT